MQSELIALAWCDVAEDRVLFDGATPRVMTRDIARGVVLSSRIDRTVAEFEDVAMSAKFMVRRGQATRASDDAAALGDSHR